MPDLDQILTAPSSPPVTIPAPSWLHLAAKQAPAFDIELSLNLKKGLPFKLQKKMQKGYLMFSLLAKLKSKN